MCVYVSRPIRIEIKIVDNTYEYIYFYVESRSHFYLNFIQISSLLRIVDSKYFKQLPILKIKTILCSVRSDLKGKYSKNISASLHIIRFSNTVSYT